MVVVGPGGTGPLCTACVAVWQLYYWRGGVTISVGGSRPGQVIMCRCTEITQGMNFKEGPNW